MTRLRTIQRKPGAHNNQLTSRSNDKCSNINKVEANGVEISDTCEIGEAFNTHFTEIGENLAKKISITDIDPILHILKQQIVHLPSKQLMLRRLKI